MVINKKGQTNTTSLAIGLLIGVAVLALGVWLAFGGIDTIKNAMSSFTGSPLATIAQGCGTTMCVETNQAGYCRTDLKSVKGLEDVQVTAIAAELTKTAGDSTVSGTKVTKTSTGEWADTKAKTAKVTCGTLAGAGLSNGCNTITCMASTCGSLGGTWLSACAAGKTVLNPTDTSDKGTNTYCCAA